MRFLDFILDQASRLALLVLGVILTVAGLGESGPKTVLLGSLGIAAIALSATLPRLTRFRLFGASGFEADLTPSRDGDDSQPK
jgi:hypothetical protein